MTRKTISNSISEHNLEAKNTDYAKHIIYYKCNALLIEGINTLLASQDNYSTKKCSSIKDLRHLVSSKVNCIVVNQLSTFGTVDSLLKDFIEQNSQIKFLMVFQESRIPISYDFLHREGVELYFMGSSRSKFISTIELLEKDFSFIQSTKSSDLGFIETSKEKDEIPIINPFDKLTRIQSEVAQQLCQGIKQKTIALNMGVNNSCITSYKKTVLRKLKVSSIAELAVLNYKYNAF